MTHVLRMDVYRLLKSRFFYIILIILLMITALSAVIADTSIHASPSDTTSSTSEQNSIVIIDDSSVSEHDSNHSNKVDFICDVFSGNVVAMTMIVFAALFAGAYRRTGYEKNVVCSVRRRWYFVASNAVICLLVCVLTVSLMLGASALSNTLIIAGYADLPFGSISKLGRFAVSYCALLVCATYMMSCFIRLCKNHIIGIVVALVYGSGIVYGIVNLALAPLFGPSFRIEAFLPLGTMYGLSVSMPDQAFYRAIVIALIFGTLSVAIDVMASNKRDIPC